MREVERRLPPELNDASDDATGPIGFLDTATVESFDDVEHILEGERFEEEKVAGVEIRGDGFRVRIDHHRFETHLLAGERRLAAAVVEFDALTDAVGSATQNDDLRSVTHPDLVIERLGEGAILGKSLERSFVRRIEVRGRRLEFSGAGIDQLENRLDSK